MEAVMVKDRVPPGIRQAAKFAIVGALNTVVDMGLYLVLAHWVGVWPVAAKVISYSVGVLNSFAWNRSWTFRSEASAWKTLALFVLVNLVALGLNAGVMHVCLDTLAAPELISLALATGVAFLWNFAVSKLVVFRE
ncbi:MAG: GtrA family protein [Chloroflexi bacterium]|nr:GtrA family protein [Chloroflexota bacterium]MBU1751487.1 GtrA family protein [Chloroflexota bacterium]MBU1880290.1 GtrA family protein [Chloroflexota bacterium]